MSPRVFRGLWEPPFTASVRFGWLLEKRRRVSVRIEDAHLAAQHIDELWQAFDTGISEEFADLSWLAGPDRHGVFRIGQHRAEFQHLKTAPATTDAGFPLQNRAGSLPLNG
jgi:hypothetical protein